MICLKNRLISAIVVFVILLSSIFTVTSYALDQCVNDMFDNLTKNNTYVPPNPVGNCYFTAISMLLMYYDTYFHDDFVADNLEWLPGEYDSLNNSLSKTFSAENEYNAWNTYLNDDTIENKSPRDFYLRNSNNFLQSHLIARGISQGFNTYVEGETYRENNRFSLTAEECLWFLNSYLTEQHLGNDKVRVYCLPGSQEELAAIMSAKVKSGYPVLYVGWREVVDETKSKPDDNGTSTRKVGHVLVAYGVDDDGDIKLHSGWNSSSTFDQLGETVYSLTPYLVWFEIDESLPHVCSKNFIEKSTNQELCACQIYNKHPFHNEHHTYFVKNNSKKQYEECVCGDMNILHYHSYTEYEYINRTIHIERCELCDYNYKTIHEYYLEPTSSTEHKQICKCGKTGATNDHIASRYVNKTKFMHNITCECGYIMGTAPHSVVTDNNRYSHCVDCGAVFDNFFDVTIKKYDDEIIPTIN